MTGAFVESASWPLSSPTGKEEMRGGGFLVLRAAWVMAHGTGIHGAGGSLSAFLWKTGLGASAAF